jgi:tRNA(Arg) A34 adenosine deaminase TadA
MYQVVDIEHLTNKEKSMFGKCINLSKQSKFETFKHGAVLFDKKVINTSFNSLNRHTRFGQRFNSNDYHVNSLHAELGAILNVPASLTIGSSVFVVRTNGLGQLRLSYPCDMCLGAMKFVGVKKVYFSIDDSTVGIMKLSNQE